MKYVLGYGDNKIYINEYDWDEYKDVKKYCFPPLKLDLNCLMLKTIYNGIVFTMEYDLNKIENIPEYVKWTIR